MDEGSHPEQNSPLTTDSESDDSTHYRVRLSKRIEKFETENLKLQEQIRHLLSEKQHSAPTEISLQERERIRHLEALRAAVPNFDGSSSEPSKGVEFVRKLKGYLDISTLSSGEKIQFLSSKLLGAASHWAANTIEQAPALCSDVDGLLKAFQEQFLPHSLKFDNARKLVRTRQGAAGINEYITNFTSNLAMVKMSNEDVKVALFVEGLSDLTKRQLLSNEMNLDSLEKAMVAAARLQEGTPKTASLERKDNIALRTDQERSSDLKYCYYCAMPGHNTANCNKKRKRNGAHNSQRRAPYVKRDKRDKREEQGDQIKETANFVSGI